MSNNFVLSQIQLRAFARAVQSSIHQQDITAMIEKRIAKLGFLK